MAIADFVGTYSGVGDGTTSNNTPFTNAEASAFERIYLPEGRYYTTLVGGAFTAWLNGTFTKRYYGPGRIYFGAGNGTLEGLRTYSGNPTPTDSTNYGMFDDVKFADVDLPIIRDGARRDPARDLYFWAPATPKFANFKNRGGWSGFSGSFNASVNSPATTATITGGTGQWTSGDIVGFYKGGVYKESKVITVVNGTTISWTGALADNYTTSDYVSHGYRTNASYNLVVLDHEGWGDAYCYNGRVTVGRPAGQPDYFLNSQTEFQNRATGAIVGGELTGIENGAYLTPTEFIVSDASDGSADIAAISVISYARKNNTAGYANVWIHDYAKMDINDATLKPLDSVYRALVKARTGLDFTQSTFSVADIALNNGGVISLDAQVVSGGSSNGNGYIATTKGDVYLKSGVSGTKFLDLVAGSGSARVTASGMTVSGSITATNGIAVGANGLSIAAGGLVVTAGGITVNGGGLSVTSGTTSVGTLTSGAFTSSGNITAASGTIRGQYLTTQSTTGQATHFIYFGDQNGGASYLVVDVAAGNGALYIKGGLKLSF